MFVLGGSFGASSRRKTNKVQERRWLSKDFDIGRSGFQLPTGAALWAGK